MQAEHEAGSAPVGKTVTAFDHRATVATGARAYTQTHDIVADTFELEARTDEVENPPKILVRQGSAPTRKLSRTTAA